LTLYICISSISPGNMGQVCVWRSSGQGHSYTSPTPTLKWEHEYNCRGSKSIVSLMGRHFSMMMHHIYRFMP